MGGAGWKHRKEAASFAPVINVPKDQLTANPLLAGRRARFSGRGTRGRSNHLRPRQRTAHGLRAGHRSVCVSHARRRGRLPRACRATTSRSAIPRRQAAEGAQREVHDRRLLRKQDERIRLELRVRADPQAAGASRHGRPDDRHRQLQRDPDSAQAGRRSEHGSRLAAGQFPAASLTRSAPGATRKAPCWPPCRWKRPCSTCCCS